MKAGFVPLALVSAVLALSGCSSTGSGGTPLIPDKAIQLTAGTAVSMSTLVAAAALGAVAYVVYDPLAPNWEIEESRLNDSTYRFS